MRTNTALGPKNASRASVAHSATDRGHARPIDAFTFVPPPRIAFRGVIQRLFAWLVGALRKAKHRGYDIGFLSLIVGFRHDFRAVLVLVGLPLHQDRTDGSLIRR